MPTTDRHLTSHAADLAARTGAAFRRNARFDAAQAAVVQEPLP